ncbi:MAG: glycosyltransferase family 2 protein [Candidatus Omnitrophota bacterium]
MKVTLLIPTLNEIGGMKSIMPRIKKEWYDQLIVLDGGSTDGTIEYAKEMGYDLYVQKKEGIKEGYKEVYDMITGDIIITFSPDGNSIAELIPPLAAKMREGYDMVIVSRYAGHAKSYDDDAVTSFGNWMFTSVINLLHGSRYTDAMVMFRAYRRKMVEELDLDKDGSYSYVEKLFNTKISWEPLLSVRAAKRKMRCADIPGDEPPRIGGERKLKIIKWGLAYLTQVITEKFVWMK